MYIPKRNLVIVIGVFLHLLNNLFVNTNHIYGKHYDMFTIKDNSEKVEDLLKIPQYEQRTEKWYEYRYKTVGASEAAALFDLNPYTNEKMLILSKCGWVDP